MYKSVQKCFNLILIKPQKIVRSKLEKETRLPTQGQSGRVLCAADEEG